MELMKALEILLGRAQPKNTKQEMEQQVHGQDMVAVLPSLHSESKAKVVEGQVSCRCLLSGHPSPLCFFSPHLPISLTLRPSLFRIISCLSKKSSSVGGVMSSASLCMKNAVSVPWYSSKMMVEDCLLEACRLPYTSFLSNHLEGRD